MTVTDGVEYMVGWCQLRLRSGAGMYGGMQHGHSEVQMHCVAT